MLKIKVLQNEFSVCKVMNFSEVDLNKPYTFISVTDEEKSLVCETKHVLSNVTDVDRGWRAFRIEGVLDFSLVGILSKLSTLMADNGIGIFAISTFNTDYILVKKENLAKVLHLLSINNYQIIQ